MQAVVETVSALELKINISIPANDYKNAYNKKLNEVSKTAHVDGFRPGKVPVAYINKAYGRSIEADVIDDLVKKSIDTACNEKQLLVAGIKNVNVTQKEVGKDLEFHVNLEIFPKVELADTDFSSASVSKYIVNVTENDVNSAINKLRKSHAIWKTADAKAKAEVGNKVIIDFKGTRDGKAIASAAADNFDLELGSNHLIAGFEDGIVGHAVGEEFTLNLKFPDTYHVAEHAGKETVFNVKLKEILYSDLPVVDEEFCKKIGIKQDGGGAHEHHEHDHTTCTNPDHDHNHSHGDEDELVEPNKEQAPQVNLVEELLTKVRSSLEAEAKQRTEAKYKKDILDVLTASKNIDVPESLVEEEIDILQNDFLEKYRKYVGDKHAKLDLDRNTFKEQAKTAVHLKLLARAFIEQYNLKATREDLKATLKQHMGGVEVDDYMLDFYYKDQNRLRQLEAITLEDLLVAEIAKKIKVEEKSVSFDELVAQDNQA